MTSTYLIKCLASLYSSLTAGYLSCKQATMQAKQVVRTEHSENVLQFMLSLQATKGSTCYIEKRVPTALLCSGQQVSHSYK